jgi:Leucine-rich repeat (LRR) protein
MYHFITELKNHQKLLKKAKDGFKCTKHGRYGKPHQKFVNLSPNLDTVHWKDMERKDKRSCFPTLEFTELKKGATTKVFQRTIQKKEDSRYECCFSLIGQKRTLDFEFANKEERDEWYAVLQAVFDQLNLQMPAKLKEQNMTLEEITKCENALKKFHFDIEDQNWKISKALTRSAKFSEDEYLMLGACLDPNPIIRTIDISENNVSDLAISNLCQSINKAPNLTQLTLSGNAISSEGLVQLAKALKANKSIKILDLRGNTITDNGAEALGKALSTNKTLEEIFFRQEFHCRRRC